MSGCAELADKYDMPPLREAIMLSLVGARAPLLAAALGWTDRDLEERVKVCDNIVK